MSSNPLPHPPVREQPGLLRRIFADPVPVLDELAGRFGPVYGLGFGPVRMAVVGDPVALRELFATPTDSFRWGHKFNVLGFVVGSESMIVSDGDDHRRRRTSVQTAFSRRRLNGWIPMILEHADRAVDGVIDELRGSPGTIDLYPVGRSLVLGIAIRSLFGERLAARTDEIGVLFQRPQAYLESPMIRQLPHRIPGTRRAKVRADRRALDAILDDEIAHQRRSPSDDPLDVLAALVDEGTLSDGEIRDQVVSLMGAGFDTTSASFAWMLWCVTTTPGLWGRLRCEADEVLGRIGEDRPADEHTLAALDLAGRCMRETLRLHPAGVVGPREAAIDMTIAGYEVPKGTLVLWSAHLAGRNATAWPDALTFDPDRFVDPPPESRALADIAWVPFGRGYRNCIGFALAQMELTLMLARFAQCLDVGASTDQVPVPVRLVVNRPSGGAPMVVSVRGNDGT
jgi:cytochrome P450